MTHTRQIAAGLTSRRWGLRPGWVLVALVVVLITRTVLSWATPAAHAGPRPSAPPFTARLLGSTATISVASLTGRPAVLDFWSSWCPPCRTELPIVADVAETTPGRVNFLGIDVRDTTGAASAALRAAHVTYPNIADPDASIANAYRVIGTPTIVILDAHGDQVGRILGPASAPAIHAMLVHAADLPARAAHREVSP